MDELIAVATLPPPPAVPAPPAGARIEHPFEFEGDAREYFRIWIVNLALSVLTLGVYSAWAKVRSERYFYGSTRVAGDPFEYLAKPWPILKGRAIALVLFGAYVIGAGISVKLQLAAAALIALAAPWLLVRGAAFRARYSAWRGISFRFVPDYAGAYLRYLVLPVAAVLTLGLLYPYAKAKQKAYFADHHRFGDGAFAFGATPGQFYPPYLVAWAVAIAAILVSSILAGIVAVAISSGHPKAGPPAWFLYSYVVLFYGSYFVVWAFLAAALANLVYDNAALGAHRFRSTLKGHELLGLYASNTVAILASAGLLVPWAKIRLARYRATRLRLIAHGDLGGFRAASRAEIGAAAAELDGLFDIDIGL